MGYKRFLLIFLGLLLLGSGLVMAIRGATTDRVADLARWTAVGTAESETTEGGNITIVNLGVNSLTERWAGFYGNLTGSIYLTDNASGTTNYLFRWLGANATDNGEVCVSTATAYDFAAAAASSGADRAAVDTAWNLGTAADNAENTFGDTQGCTLTFSEQGITVSTIFIDHGTSTFNTCLINDGATTSKNNFAFCAKTRASGTTYNNQPANYELMVPVDYSTGIETYYFYAELD